MFFDFWKTTPSKPTTPKQWEADFTQVHFWAKPSEALLKHLQNLGWQYLREQPQNQVQELEYAVAQCYGLAMENVLILPFLEEGIMRVAQLFAQEKISFHIPTHAIFQQATEIYQAEARTSTLIKFQYNTPLAFLNNPNFPDGQVFYIDELENILDRNPKTLFCVNEELNQYTNNLRSAASLIKHYKNLLVLNAPARICGIAGLELAFLVGHKQWIKKLKNDTISPVFNTPAVESLKFVLQLDKFGINTEIAYLSNKRKIFADKINEINGLRALNSQTHFFLVEITGKTTERLQSFLNRKYKIKIYPEEKIEGLPQNYFGISLLSDSQNELLLKALADFMS